MIPEITVKSLYTRSININRDASSRELIDSFIPTTSSLALFNRVLGGINQKDEPRAFSVVSPYGTGKSAATNFLSHLLQPPNLDNQNTAWSRLEKDSLKTSAGFREKIQNSAGYLKVLITGASESLGHRITRSIYQAVTKIPSKKKKKERAAIELSLKNLLEQNEISVNALLDILGKLQILLKTLDYLGIFIAIDELGKFLEYEAKNYGSNDIYFLQGLAELAYKGNKTNLFLLVLLHQNIEQYAIGTSENLRKEWSKIQGRFEEISFTESNEQVLRLLSSSLSNNLPSEEVKLLNEEFKTITEVLAKEEVFPKSTAVKDMAKLFYNCYPFHPLTSYLLPILCQKVAQNERTLFNFIGSQEETAFKSIISKFSDHKELVLPHHIFNFFIENRPSNQLDSQTQRRWIEVDAAIERLGDAPLQTINLLKTIGLVNIAGSRGGLKSSPEILKSLDGYVGENLDNNIELLQTKSIITYRKFNNEYRVWQGSDLDLDDLVASQISSYQKQSLAELLNNNHTLSPIVARRYTIESGTLRFYSPIFEDVRTLSNLKKSDTPNIIIFLAAGKEDEKFFIDQALPTYSSSDLVLLCGQNSLLHETVLQVKALREIFETNRELHEDTIASRELQHRLQQLQSQEKNLLDKLLSPKHNTEWYWKGTKRSISSHLDLQKLLSKALSEVFNKAPLIHNELINRDNISTQAKGARKKLLEAMLRNPEKKIDLGIDKFPPEKAIFKSVIASELYDVENNQFIAPKKSSSFYSAWKEIEQYLEKSEDEPVSFVDLNSVLLSPPYGIKAGVLPIIYLAYYLANKNEIAIYENRLYRPGFDDEMLQRFIKKPNEFQFQVFRIAGVKSSFFEEYKEIIDTKKKDSVVALSAPLIELAGKLPKVIRNTSSVGLISQQAQDVRNALLHAKSPMELLFEGIPRALGYEMKHEGESKVTGLAQDLGRVLKELSRSFSKLLELQRTTFCLAFNLSLETDLPTLRSRLYKIAIELEDYTSDRDIIKPLLIRVLKKDISDNEWFSNILLYLGNLPIENWDDGMINEVSNRLKIIVNRINELEIIKQKGILHGYQASTSGEAKLVRIVKANAEPLEKMVLKPSKIDNSNSNNILKILDSIETTEQKVSILVEILETYLSSPQKNNE